MWKRQIKNKFGSVTKVTTSDQMFQRENVYDSLPGIKYTVEYLRRENEEAFDNSQKRGSDIEPYELYDTFETDSLGLAIHEVLIRMFDNNCVDYKLFMETEDKDTCVEIPATVYHTCRQLLNDDMNHRLEQLNETVKYQETEIENFREFLKSVHGEEVYKKWLREKKGV